MYHNVSTLLNIPVSVEIVAGFILQRSIKVEAAFVDEKLDELSKKKREKKRKEKIKRKERNLSRGIQCADKNE